MGISSLLMTMGVFAGVAQGQPIDLTSLGRCTPIVADGVDLKLGSADTEHGKALDIAYDFHKLNGYVLAQTPFGRRMPHNFEFSFWMRGDTPDNNLEFKLNSPGAKSVWWYKLDNYQFPTKWTHYVIRKRKIQFAWGEGGGDPSEIESVQIGVSTGSGGKGHIEIADFEYRELGEYGDATDAHEVAATSGSAKGLGTGKGSWRSKAADATLTIAYPKMIEFAGLQVDWQPGRRADAYTLETSPDNATWTPIAKVSGKKGLHDLVFTRDAEGRFIRMILKGGANGLGVDHIKVLAAKAGDSSAGAYGVLANASPRGFFMRHLLNEQGYWTLVGYSGGADKALLCEDGQVELANRMPSLDPFLIVDGKALTWGNTNETQSLLDGYLPIPSVTRQGPVSLKVTAFATKEDGGTVYVTYRVTNTTRGAKKARLAVTLRPIQVNPEWQHSGDIAPISELATTPTSMTFNGSQTVRFDAKASAHGASTFADGEVGTLMQFAQMPDHHSVKDSDGLASGVLAYDLTLAPHESKAVTCSYGLSGATPHAAKSEAQVDALRSRVADAWRKELGQFKIDLPGSAHHLIDILRSNMAYTLINRDGVRLQPGSRNYKRSWIRDGSLMAASMVHFGVAKAAEGFAEWYAPYIHPDGYVPCIVDSRGPDSLLESDAFGEFIYLVAETYRFTHDRAFLKKMYPYAVRVAEYIERDSKKNRDKYEQATGLEHTFAGLLSPSVSHEGYGQPVYSYWDDFFALKGLKDVSYMAGQMGDNATAEHFGAFASEFRSGLMKSIVEAAAIAKVPYIPGCAERGDFDATSTSIAISPGGEMANLPQNLLEGTFNRYWNFCKGRIDGAESWSGYTPYELRTLSSMVRMGHRDRAQAALEFFVNDTRPFAWNQWAEVVWKIYRQAGYIGDMPHTWCAAEFVRSFRDFFVYEDEKDAAVVLAAGVPLAWLKGKGMKATDLPTEYGSISLTGKSAKEADTYRVSGSVKAPGGVWLVSARDIAPRSVTVNGKPVAPAKRVRLTVFPSKVVFAYGG